MIKKILKIAMILIMLVGIAFSITNFLSVESKAEGSTRGAWVYVNDTYRCMGDGNECEISP